jgi:hypothetical protein
MKAPRTYEQFLPRVLASGELRACGACGALVASEDQEQHTGWHRTLAGLVTMPVPPLPEDDG